MTLFGKYIFGMGQEQVRIKEKLTGLELANKPDTELDKLKEYLNRYSNLMDLASDGAATISPRGIVTYCNPAFIKLTGYSENEIIGRHITKIPTILKKDIPRFLKLFNSLIKGKNIKDFEFVYRTKNKELRNCKANIGLAKKNGKISEIQIILKDITEQIKAEDSIKRSEERYRNLFETSPVGIVTLNRAGIITACNKMVYKLSGYLPEVFIGKHFAKTRGMILKDIPKYLKMFSTLLKGEEQEPFEATIRNKKGENFVGEVYVARMEKENRIIGFQILIRDVTEQKNAERRIKYLSFHDNLTGLYNRAYFDEELQRLDSKRYFPLSIIMGDLNGLKLINDAFGHLKGDLILCKISKILENCLRKGDIIARWGGDEFSILLPNTDIIDTSNVVERIKRECIKTNKQKIPVSVSLGMAIKEKPGQDIQDILKESEDNMYKQKLLESNSFSSSIIMSLKRTLWEKSRETEEHANRLKELSIDIGKAIDLPHNKIDELSLLADLHDIGKITISDEILLKKNRLIKSEWEIVKRHPEIGYNIVQSSVQLAHIAPAILSHHEHWDGSGYPQGLHGEEIPIISRIIAIVDAYDVMRYGRVYETSMSEEEYVLELEKNSGTQFDPTITRIFIDEILYNKSNKEEIISLVKL